MINKIKEKSKELALNSTAYGIPNIFRSENSFNKIFWIFFTIVSTAASSYYISADISGFLDYEVVTVFRKNYEQPVEFPTVTFCSYLLNYFDRKNLTQLIIQTDINYDLSMNFSLNDHFEQFQSTHYGKCFRFNSGKNLDGISIPIKNSTLGGYDDAFHLKMLAPNGLIIWIHNKSTRPKVENYNKHSDIPIFISTKMRNFLVIDKIIESKLGEPYNQCLQNVFTDFDGNKTILDYFNSMNEQYTQVKCFELCFDLDYIETNPCNCTNASLDNVWNNCWLIDEKKVLNSCTFKNRAEFHKKNLKEKCSKYCPLECDSISFEVTPNIFTGSNVDNETIELYVFYRNLRFVTIEERPKTIWKDLIANVGGYFGLFVGISFVTLFEITEVIIESVFILCTKKNRISSVTLVSNQNFGFK